MLFLLLFSFWQNIIIHLGQWPLCGYQQAPLRFIPLLATARPVSSFCESYGKGKLLTETWKCRRIRMSRDTQYPQKDTQPFEKVSDYLFFFINTSPVGVLGSFCASFLCIGNGNYDCTIVCLNGVRNRKVGSLVCFKESHLEEEKGLGWGAYAL